MHQQLILLTTSQIQDFHHQLYTPLMPLSDCSAKCTLSSAAGVSPSSAKGAIDQPTRSSGKYSSKKKTVLRAVNQPTTFPTKCMQNSTVPARADVVVVELIQAFQL